MKSWRKALGLNKCDEIGHVLCGFRIKSGWTQKELAHMVGVKQHHISEMEHAKKYIDREMGGRLAKVFKIGYKVFL